MLQGWNKRSIHVHLQLFFLRKIRYIITKKLLDISWNSQSCVYILRRDVFIYTLLSPLQHLWRCEEQEEIGDTEQPVRWHDFLTSSSAWMVICLMSPSLLLLELLAWPTVSATIDLFLNWWWDEMTFTSKQPKTEWPWGYICIYTYVCKTHCKLITTWLWLLAVCLVFPRSSCCIELWKLQILKADNCYTFLFHTTSFLLLSIIVPVLNQLPLPSPLPATTAKSLLYNGRISEEVGTLLVSRDESLVTQLAQSLNQVSTEHM